MNLWAIFLTGLTVGGLTCLAVQGGLLASVIAAREEDAPVNTKKHALFATLSFLVAKLIAYTLLGFLLGAFGGAVNISNEFQTFMQLIAGFYMVAVALNLLNIHPVFRYVIIQPPKFLTKLVRKQSRSKDIFAPALLGAMTIFIPCGTTLAIEALAISSANPFYGALITAFYTLGTIPLFFGIGFLTSILGEAYKTKFLKLAAVLVLYLGLSSINGSLVALGSPFSFQNIVQSITAPANQEQANSNIPVNQNPEIFITNYGYNPNYIKVSKGSPVTLTLTNNGTYSCASAFRIPSFGVAINVGLNQSRSVTFTPTQSGQFTYSCSMGMYTGIIEVVEGQNESQT